MGRRGRALSSGGHGARGRAWRGQPPACLRTPCAERGLSHAPQGSQRAERRQKPPLPAVRSAAACSSRALVCMQRARRRTSSRRAVLARGRPVAKMRRKGSGAAVAAPCRPRPRLTFERQSLPRSANRVGRANMLIMAAYETKAGGSQIEPQRGLSTAQQTPRDPPLPASSPAAPYCKHGAAQLFALLPHR